MSSDLYVTHGGIPVFGILVSHSWHEIGAVLQVIHEYKIDCFVEIGIHRGGLGSMLLPYCYYNPDFSYMGLDIDRKIVEPSFLVFAAMLKNAKLLYLDSICKPAIRLVKEFISTSKRPMIYCDGGNKPLEFDVYSRNTPTGTLLMVHDYPKEFREEHFQNSPWVQRIDKPYLELNRQILFKRL